MHPLPSGTLPTLICDTCFAFSVLGLDTAGPLSIPSECGSWIIYRFAFSVLGLDTAGPLSIPSECGSWIIYSFFHQTVQLSPMHPLPSGTLPTLICDTCFAFSVLGLDTAGPLSIPSECGSWIIYRFAFSVLGPDTAGPLSIPSECGSWIIYRFSAYTVKKTMVMPDITLGLV